MNTPAHLLIGGAVFGRGKEKRVVLAAMLGGLLPDLSLFVLAGTSLFLLNIPAQVVFDELYFSPLWQTIFAIDNSFLLWGALLVFALYSKSQWATALCGSALLHLLFDFPLHHDDGRAHFWPSSNWVFESPVSYWDRRQGAALVAPAEALLATIAAVVLWRQNLGITLVVAVGMLLAAELWIVRQWLFFFVDG